MPLYDELEVRPRYGSALPSYAPEGTRSLEPGDGMDLRGLAIEAAAAGALGSGVGNTYARAMQPYSEWRAADDALTGAWSARVQELPEAKGRKEIYNELENLIGRSSIRGDYRAGKTPKGFHGHDFWRDGPVGNEIWDATNKAAERHLAKLPGQASGKVVSINPAVRQEPAAFNRLVDLGEDRLAAKSILSPEVDDLLRREAGIEFDHERAQLSREEGRIFSEDELAKNRRLNKKAWRADRAAWGDALEGLYDIEERGGGHTGADYQGRRLTGERIEELIRDVPMNEGVRRSPFFPTKAGGRMLVNLLKETLRPRNVLMDATLGAGVGAASAGLGYEYDRPRSAGLFTPPGAGYEGVVTSEGMERVAEAKEALKEQERQRLLEQYRASGYDLDPSTRLSDLR